MRQWERQRNARFAIDVGALIRLVEIDRFDAAGQVGFGRLSLVTNLRAQAIESPRVGDGLTDMFEAADPRDDPLDAHSEPSVRHAAVPP